MLAAGDHCDKHVLKMIVESAQMLSTAHHILEPAEAATKSFLKPTHANHPCAVWVRQSRWNYVWLYRLAGGLLREYQMRYRPEKGHAYSGQTGLVRRLQEPPAAIPDVPFVDPPQCLPDAYKRPDTVEAYRAYYLGEKARFATWRSPARVPTWWTL